MAYAADLHSTLLSTYEVAEMLNQSQATVRRWCQEGKLHARRITTRRGGSRWFISEASVLAVQESPKVQVVSLDELIELGYDLVLNTGQLIATVADGLRIEHGDLTVQERQVFALAGAGLSQAEIGLELGLHKRSVQRRMASAGKKLEKSFDR